jgi:hypothetical protein
MKLITLLKEFNLVKPVIKVGRKTVKFQTLTLPEGEWRFKFVAEKVYKSEKVGS